MKKTFTLLVLTILTISIWAQSPNKFSYQAVVRDADNNLVVEQAVGMQISVLQSSATGTAVYTETHTPNTNANGLVTVEIGSGATTDDFSSIDWSAGPYFLKTEIDPAGGTSYTITGTSQLLSVPYAKFADKAGNTFSGDYGDLNGAPTNVSDFTNDEGYLTEVTGSETAFDGWDKNSSDDFSGNYNDLSNKPASVAVKQTPALLWAEITGSYTALTSINVEAPADGYFLVIASGSLALQKTSSASNASWGIDLHTAPDVAPGVTPNGGSKSATRGYFDSSETFSSSIGIPFNLQEVFSVTKGTSYDYYINARAVGFSSAYLFHPNIAVIFIPSAL